MPVGAEVLSIHSPSNGVHICARVDPGAAPEMRTFVAVASGNELPSTVNLKFIGTVLWHQESYMLHVFEVLHHTEAPRAACRRAIAMNAPWVTPDHVTATKKGPK